jgi:cytohesin
MKSSPMHHFLFFASACFFLLSVIIVVPAFAQNEATLSREELIELNEATLSREKLNELRKAIIKNDLAYIKKTIREDPSALRKRYPNETLLAYSVIYQKIDLVRYLLEQGADPNQASILGDTPMDRVAWNGNIKIAELLIRHGALVDCGRISGESDAETPFIRAARENKVEMCKFLLENGADGRFITGYNINALISAVRNSNYEIEADVDFLRFLVESGSDVNIIINRTSPDRSTPLLWVAKARRQDLYDFLASVGADPNYKDHYGHTPADYLKGKAIPKD